MPLDTNPWFRLFDQEAKTLLTVNERRRLLTLPPGGVFLDDLLDDLFDLDGFSFVTADQKPAALECAYCGRQRRDVTATCLGCGATEIKRRRR